MSGFADCRTGLASPPTYSSCPYMDLLLAQTRWGTAARGRGIHSSCRRLRLPSRMPLTR